MKGRVGVGVVREGGVEADLPVVQMRVRTVERNRKGEKEIGG